MNTKKIVITGGPSTGKTSVIEELETRGFNCLHEVIRLMTLQKKGEDETISFKSNPIVSVADPTAFNQSILDARIEQYNTGNIMEAPIIFFDRGIPDVLAYMDCFGQEYSKEFLNACHDHQYDFVFLMPPWKEIHKVDNERFESYEESLRVYESLHKTYTELGYNLIIVPKDSIQNRIDFILNFIKDSA